MESKLSSQANVVRFPGRQTPYKDQRDQKSLMDAVYAVGILPIAADDRETKMIAARLNIAGFIMIDEMQDGESARRLRASEAIYGSTRYPWRLSKPSSFAPFSLMRA